MANRIYLSNFDQINKSFEEITNFVKDIAKNNKGTTRKQRVEVGEKLAHLIEKKYTDYIRKISKLEHGTKNVHVSVEEQESGCVVKIFGKDVLYHEYGTGTRGLQSNHPRHNADGMKPYGSGRNIIHNGKRKDGKETPYWYKVYRDFPGYYLNDFNNDSIRATDYVWRHNGIITKGLPAGRFIYDSINTFKNDKEIKTDVKKILSNGIKETITPKIKQKTKHISQQLNNKKPEVKIVQSSEAAKNIFKAKLSAILDSKR